MNLNLNSYIWLVATVLESEALKRPLTFYAIFGGCVEKAWVLTVGQTRILNLVPPLTTCITLYKYLISFPSLYNRIV